MAVDLTTGTYNKEGVFSKHNEQPEEPAKFDIDENFCSLKNFRTTRVIKEANQDSLTVVEGRFAGDDKPAIVVIEKTPFQTANLNQLFSANCRLELISRNDIYSNYHAYPQNGYNGFDIKVIYPAREEDFLEFVDEPFTIVNETAEIYKSIVLPHFNDIKSSKDFMDDNPNVPVLCKEKNPEYEFTLLEYNPKKCLCFSKHVRAVCIIKHKELFSLRDLTPEHVPLLKSVEKKCLEELASKYTISESKFLSYVFYPPKYFPFNIYFETTERDDTVCTDVAQPLETLICNLQLIPDYYKKVTLTYSLKEKDTLLKKMKDYSNSEQ